MYALSYSVRRRLCFSQKANNILKKYGFEIITTSANEFVDHTDYSKEDGFNFLELDESQFITEATVEEISSFTDSISLSSTNLFGDWIIPDATIIITEVII